MKAKGKRANGKLSAFRPQRANLNQGTSYGLKLLDDSIRRDGWIGGITTAADGETFAGSKRLERSVDIFGAEIEPIVIESDGTRPVIIKRMDIPTADDERAKRLGFVDNHSAVVSWNPDAALLAALARDDQISAQIANQNDQLRKLLAGNGHLEETADVGELVDRAQILAEKWEAKTGQLWEIGDHHLAIGDATDNLVIETVMHSGRAALLLTDPPYNVGVDYGKETDDTKTVTEYEAFSRLWFGTWRELSDRQIVTPGCYNLASWARWFEPYHIAPWTKINSMTNGKVARWWCWEPIFFYGDKWTRKRPNDIFDYPIGQQKEVADHPCPKPLKMWIDLLENYSNPGDIVADAFAGSGTTLIACEQTKRKARLVEVEPKFAAVTLERWANLTGFAPRLIA